MDDIEKQIAKLDGDVKYPNIQESIVLTELSTNISQKRKLNSNTIKEEPKNNYIDTADDVVNLLSDSDNEANSKPTNTGAKKPKLEPICEEPPKLLLKDNEIKNENELLEYEAFNVKQEYLGFDDEPIQIDSDSDSESEQWLLRLSQNSPGKPFIKMAKRPKSEVTHDDSSYSQLDDFVSMNNLNFEESDEDDIDSMPVHLPVGKSHEEPNKTHAEPEKSREVPEQSTFDTLHEIHPHGLDKDNQSEELFEDNIITLIGLRSPTNEDNRDEVDAFGTDSISKQTESPVKSSVNDSLKKTRMIEPMILLPKSRSNRVESKF